jgi:hypothetical protein
MSGLTSTGDPEKVKEKLYKSLGKTTTSFIPNLFKQIDKIYDPTIYDSKSIKASILKEIPIVKELSDLKPKLNGFGQPSEKTGTRFYNKVTNDPVWLLMAKYELFTPGISPNTKNIYGVLMTQEEFYDYTKEAGRIAYENIKNNLESTDSYFSELTPEERRAELKYIFDSAKKESKYYIADKYPIEY